MIYQCSKYENVKQQFNLESFKTDYIITLKIVFLNRLLS